MSKNVGPDEIKGLVLKPSVEYVVYSKDVQASHKRFSKRGTCSVGVSDSKSIILPLGDEFDDEDQTVDELVIDRYALYVFSSCSN